MGAEVVLMKVFFNNTWYVIVAIVSMGCAMQGLEWKSNKKKEKAKRNGNYTL